MKWRYRWEALKLFFSLVGRTAVSWSPERITICQAWRVAKIVWLEDDKDEEE